MGELGRDEFGHVYKKSGLTVVSKFVQVYCGDDDYNAEALHSQDETAHGNEAGRSARGHSFPSYPSNDAEVDQGTSARRSTPS